MSNATEFISAYNTVDARLRAMYHGKGSPGFADLVRRCAEGNATVRKYEEELVSFARLRNAIVHESTKETVIAEPNDEATALFSHIAALLDAPPRLSELKEKKVTGIEAEMPLSEAVKKIARSSYSNLPVYRKGRMVGILNNRRIVHTIGLALDRGENVADVLALSCADVVWEEDIPLFYRILGKDDTIQTAIDAFEQNRKLLAVIVKNGGEIVNILTAADLPRLYRLLQT